MAAKIGCSSSCYQVPLTIRFSTEELVTDREVVSSSSPGTIEDRPLKDRCYSLACLIRCHCSPCYTKDLERARIRGITNFEIFLKEQFGTTPYVIASKVRGISLSSLKTSQSPLLLRDALLLRKQTEIEFKRMVALNRYLKYYLIAKYRKDETYIEANYHEDFSYEAFIANKHFSEGLKGKLGGEGPLVEKCEERRPCSLAQMISEIETIPTTPEIPKNKVLLLAESALTRFHPSVYGTMIASTRIFNAVIFTLRLKGFEIKKPDIFIQINRLFGTPKWWECFTGDGNTDADQTDIQTFKIYLESLFSSQAVFEASISKRIDLKTCQSLTQEKAKKIYKLTKLLHARGDLFYSFLLETFGIVATHTTLGLMKVTIESINHRGVFLSQDYMQEFLSLAEAVKHPFSYDFSQSYNALRFYHLFHVTPFPPEREESKEAIDYGFQRVDHGKPSFSQIDVRKRIEEIPYLNFNSSELTALSARVFEKIQDRYLTIHELEILIIKTVLSHVARTQGKTIEEIRSRKRLFPEPPLLKQLTTKLGKDSMRFIGMLQLTPLENLTPTDLVILYNILKR